VYPAGVYPGREGRRAPLGRMTPLRAAGWWDSRARQQVPGAV